MPLEDRDLVRFRDMEIYAKRAMDYLDGVTPEAFAEDTLVQDAVVRCFEVIGEAARAVSDDGKARHPAIPWPFIIGMRNRVVHEYHRIDLALVHATVTRELPDLMVMVRDAIDAATRSDQEEPDS